MPPPTVVARPQDTHFTLKRKAGRQGHEPSIHRRLNVIGMMGTCPTPTLDLLDAQSGVFQPPPVVVIDRTIGPRGPHHLGHGVFQKPEPLDILPLLGFAQLTRRYIFDHYNEVVRDAIRITHQRNGHMSPHYRAVLTKEAFLTFKDAWSSAE